MTIGSDEIPREVLILFMVLAITFTLMLLLYQLISKRILYNTQMITNALCVTPK